MKDLSGAQQNKMSGLVGTIVFHGMLLVFLVFAGLSTQVPYPESGGVEVALGEPDAGGPDDEPASRTEQTTSPASSVPEEQTPEELTSDDEDAPVTEEKKKVETPQNVPVKPNQPANTSPSTNTNNKPADQTKTAPKLNPALTYKGAGSGTGQKPGNEGQEWGTPGGDPKGKGGSGGGTGTGIGAGSASGLGIPGRRTMKKPNLTDDVQESCDVGVEITVDSRGRVTTAKAVLSNSTTMNRNIWKKAENNAMQLEYDPSDDGGTVTHLITIKFRPK